MKLVCKRSHVLFFALLVMVRAIGSLYTATFQNGKPVLQQVKASTVNAGRGFRPRD